MSMTNDKAMERSEMTKSEDFFKALSDETQQGILKILERKQMSISEIAQILQVSQPTISINLDILKKVGLIESKQKGQNIYYSLSKNYSGELNKHAKSELGVDFNYSPLTPQIETWIRTKIQRFAKSVNENIRQEVADIIIEGLDKGYGIREISGNIADHLNQTKDYWSDTIAGTEVHGASNKAILEAYKQSGVVKKKQWIAKLDGRTRDTHAKAHGQIVGIDEYFKVGDALLMFPGDICDSPKEVINCRCTIKAVFD
jgi:SPP1 gp7 family putative phage head morphogenesis protein